MAARSERPSQPIAGQRRRERGSAAHRLLKLHQEKIIKGDCVFVMAARCVRPKEQGVGGLTSALTWVRGGALLIFWKGLEGPAAAWDRGGGPPARRWGGAGGFGAVEFVPHAQLTAVLASSNGGGGQQGSAVGIGHRSWVALYAASALTPHSHLGKRNWPFPKRRKQKCHGCRSVVWGRARRRTETARTSSKAKAEFLIRSSYPARAAVSLSPLRGWLSSLMARPACFRPAIRSGCQAALMPVLLSGCLRKPNQFP